MVLEHKLREVVIDYFEIDEENRLICLLVVSFGEHRPNLNDFKCSDKVRMTHFVLG